MTGRIEDRQLVTVEPGIEPALDDAVLCVCKGQQYLHLVRAVQGHGAKRRYMIASNKGRTNGWVGRAAIFGGVTDVRDHEPMCPGGCGHALDVGQTHCGAAECPDK